MTFDIPEEKPFENMGIRETAGNQYFVLIPQCLPVFPSELL